MEEELISGIYKITNPKDRVYIGQAVNLLDRFEEYKKLYLIKGQRRLYNSLKKYGVENHIFEIWERCEEKDLNKIERYWQDYYDVLSPRGMNCLLTKTGDKSGRLSQKTKDKISKANKGKKRTDEFKKNQSLIMKNRKFSQKDIIKNLEILRLGRESTHKKVINVITGKIYKSMREAHKIDNIPFSESYFRKMLRGENPNKTNYKFYK